MHVIVHILTSFLLHYRALLDTKVHPENQDNLALLYVYFTIYVKGMILQAWICVITGVDWNFAVLSIVYYHLCKMYKYFMTTNAFLIWKRLTIFYYYN